MLAEWFRGLGKSHLFELGYGTWCTLFNKENYITVISDTIDQAEMLMLSVKTELAENPKIQQDFGEMRSHNWEASEFDTTNGVRWKGFGWQSKYRGTKFMQHRPGLVFVDDFENDKNVRNPDQVNQRYDFLLSVVIPALGKRWQLFVLATKLARYSVTSLLEKNEAVYKSIIAAETPTGRATCPESFPKSRLDEIRKVMGTVKYAKEYLLRIVSDETSAFRDEWMTRIDRPAEKYERIVSFLDPSVGKSQKNDFKALVTVGWNGQQYDVLPSWIRRTTIDHMIRASYEQYLQQRPMQFALETNGFQVLLKREFERAAKTHGYQLPIKPVIQKENKTIRILRLSPLIENGMIRFVKGGDNERLISQLLDFDENSDATPDDGPDALEGAIHILERMLGKSSQAQAAIL